MTDEFRYLIANTVDQKAPAIELADAILAMPEMQAIRRVLGARDLSYSNLTQVPVGTWLRRAANLPDSVIDWVLS